MVHIKYKRMSQGTVSIKEPLEGDNGIDIRCNEDLVVHPFESVDIPTGIALEIPKGYAVVVLPRSSMTFVKGFVCSGGLVDFGYRGEIHVQLSYQPKNFFKEFMAMLASNFLKDIKNKLWKPIYINRGSKIAQILVIPSPEVTLEEVDTLSDSLRGEKKFGERTGV